MSKIVIKGILISSVAMFALSGCTSSHENLEHSAKKQSNYAKKLQEERAAKREVVDLKKFCFKDNHSIHYRVEERCK